jgi:hypothetical protein
MYAVAMAADAVEPPRARNFTDASPKEIRAALIPEEQAEFDASWRTAMTEAAETQDLSGVFGALASWRVHAEITQDLGHEGYRRWLARAERIARTGELPPDTVPLEDVQALIRERLGL